MRRILVGLVLGFFVASLSWAGEGSFRVWSPAFPDGGRIPVKYIMPGAGGENLSPPLTWKGEPRGTKSFAISCHDPHPVAHNWVHWLVINIPPSVHSLPEGASRRVMPSGSVELINSFGFVGYGGPMPPPGTGEHPYVFTVYALKVEKLNLSGRLSLSQFQESLAPYLLGKAWTTGYFSR
jgi:Raf kinase inhibitor-like YbhB/YbcL family protein